MTVCEAICGDYRPALPVAASRQLLLAAADVFDDIEDADSTKSLAARYGNALSTNAATTLLILAEKAITRLRLKGVEDSVVIRAMELLNSYYATACAGQHLDLTLTSSTTCSEDDYLNIASMKSASQVECACHLGALVAEASDDLTDRFATFGHSIGMASQIANDIQGIIEGNDIIRRRITLPVIYALNHANRLVHGELQDIFTRPAESTPDFTQVRDALFRCGAIHYAMVKLEFYRQQAHDTLSLIGKVGVDTAQLKLLLY